MSDFEGVLESLKKVLETLQQYPEVLKTLHGFLDTFRLILAAVLGSVTKIIVTSIQSRQGQPPRSLGQKVGGSFLSLVFCVVAMATLGTVAGRVGAAPNDPGLPSQLIRAGFMVLTVTFFYNALSMAVSLFFALFFGRAGFTGVVLIVVMVAGLAVMNAPGAPRPLVPPPLSWPPDQAVWRSPTHTLVCSSGAYQLDRVPVLLERAFPDRLLFRYPDGRAFEVFQDGRFGYQELASGPLVEGFAGRWDAN